MTEQLYIYKMVITKYGYIEDDSNEIVCEYILKVGDTLSLGSSNYIVEEIYGNTISVYDAREKIKKCRFIKNV